MSPSSLPAIPLTVEPTTGNVRPLLHQVRHALKRLIDTGESCVIDLRAIPLAGGDEDRLERFLGTGELEARVHALGATRVWETRYPGVWMVVHHNGVDEVVGKYIEVVRVPEILRSQPEDMVVALAALEEKIARREPA